MTENIPVLIVGAGPTGLTLACELARRGVAVRIVEASPGPQPGSRGKGVQPRTLEAFDDLGIVDRVLSNGRMAMPIRSTGPDGRTTESDAASFRDRPDIPYPASLITPEWRVEEALRGLLIELGGTVEFGTALESFSPDDAGVTAVVRRDGSHETIRANWLIGADGGHSIVRRNVGITFDGETLEDVRMIVADVPVEGLDRSAWHMWRHAEGMVTLCPLPSTTLFQYQASIAPGQNPDTALANMQAILETRTGRSDIRVGEPTWRSLWRANIRLVDRYRAGRVLLAGDAAHIHSPAGGQGMNTGIQDAHNLGWKLAAVERGDAPLALIDSYESERRPVAEGVLALSNARLRQALDERGITIRGDATTMQLTVGYRGSVLARDDRSADAEVRAGDRVPDVPGLRTVDGECRLFDLTRGGGWTLLRFGAAPVIDAPVIDAAVIDAAVIDAAPAVRCLDVVDLPVVVGEVADPDGRLAATFGVGSDALVLLRPDGYVGAIADGDDISAVTGLLELAGVRVRSGERR